MKDRYILLEGVDLSGKSTVLKGIKHLYPSAHFHHSSLNGENPVLDRAKKAHKDGSEDVGWLYLEALKIDLDTFIWPKGMAVQDSSILLRSLGYQSAAGYTALVKEFEELSLSHPKFDHVYILTVEMEKRRERLNKRIMEDPERVTANDLKVLQDPLFFKKMEEALIDYSFKIFPFVSVINTGDFSTDEVVQQICMV